MMPTRCKREPANSLLGWPSPSLEPTFSRPPKVRTPSHIRQVASRDDAEATTQTHMNERLALLLSPTRRGLCSSSLFCPCGLQRPLFRSFFVCVGVISSLFSKAFHSLTTLVCSLLDPSALFDHRRDQTN